MITLLEAAENVARLNTVAHAQLTIALSELREVVEREKQKTTFWMNIYGETPYHATKEEADKFHSKNRVACVPVSFEVGEGISQ